MPIIYTATPSAKRTHYDADQVMRILMPDVKRFVMHYTDFKMIHIYTARKCSNMEFFWSELLRKSPYSVQIGENMDQKNYVVGHFSRI